MAIRATAHRTSAPRTSSPRRHRLATPLMAGIAVIAVIALTAPAAHADSTEPIGAAVSGGGLSATVSGVTLNGVTINGLTTQHAVGDAASTWTIIDARGTGAAWGLSVSGTAFTSAAGTTETTPRTLPITDLTVTGGTVTPGAGSDTIPAGGTVPVALTPQLLVTSAADAKGSFTLTPHFDLSVPQDAYRSNYAVGSSGTLNAYISTLTFTIA